MSVSLKTQRGKRTTFESDYFGDPLNSTAPVPVLGAQLMEELSHEGCGQELLASPPKLVTPWNHIPACQALVDN